MPVNVMAPRVLLAFPWIREEDSPKHAPFGLSIIASIARREGAKVAFYDMNAARSVISKEQTWRELEDVAREGWDIVATGGLTTVYSCVKELGRRLRPLLPDSLFVLGGNLVTSLPNEIMSWLPEFDIACIGDAWETFVDVLQHESDRDWAKVLGVAWRDSNGLVLNNLRPPIQNLDSLPFPAWDLLPMEIYFKNSSILLSEEAWTAKKRCDLATSYGCPLRCRFCLNESMIGEMQISASPYNLRDVNFKWAGKHVYHYHSTDYIIREIRHAEKLLWNVEPRGPIDYVAFLDENYITSSDVAGSNRIFEVRDAWIQAGFRPQCIRDGVPHNPENCHGKHVTATSHAGRIRPELLIAMKEMGMAVLDYGIESFSAVNMKETQKGSTPILNIRALRMTNHFGIRPCPNQILGFPTESFTTIRENVAAWKEIGVIVYPFMLTSFPGTYYFTENRKRIAEQYGEDLELFIMDLGDCTKPTATICDFTVEELTKLREWMVKGEREAIDKYENVWRKKHGFTLRTFEEQVLDWAEAEKKAQDPKAMWPPRDESPLPQVLKPEHLKIRGF